MDGDEKDIIKEVSKAVNVKRCPKCNGLSLRYDDCIKKVVCEDCGFEVLISTA